MKICCLLDIMTQFNMANRPIKSFDGSPHTAGQSKAQRKC